MVLCLENNRAIRTIIETILSNNGYEVVIAENGMDALEYLDSNASEIDALITGVNIQKIPIQDFVKQVNKGFDRKTMPIVLVVSNSDEAIYKDLEVAAKVVTPIEPGKLIDIVSKQIKQKK